VSQQQRQQFGFVDKFETETSLQLGGSQQELLTAWEIVCAACAILVFSASPFDPRVLVNHSFKSLKKKRRSFKSQCLLKRSTKKKLNECMRP
jgi:hypothetical protein